MDVIGLYQNVILSLRDGREVDMEEIKECYLRLSVELDRAMVGNLSTEEIGRNRDAVMWLIGNL